MRKARLKMQSSFVIALKRGEEHGYSHAIQEAMVRWLDKECEKAARNAKELEELLRGEELPEAEYAFMWELLEKGYIIRRGLVNFATNEEAADLWESLFEELEQTGDFIGLYSKAQN